MIHTRTVFKCKLKSVFGMASHHADWWGAFFFAIFLPSANVPGIGSVLLNCGIVELLIERIDSGFDARLVRYRS